MHIYLNFILFNENVQNRKTLVCRNFENDVFIFLRCISIEQIYFTKVQLIQLNNASLNYQK